MTADELKQRRRRLGLTQAELADRLGIALGTLRNWEQDRRRIPFPQIIELSLADIERRKDADHAWPDNA